MKKITCTVLIAVLLFLAGSYAYSAQTNQEHDTANPLGGLFFREIAKRIADAARPFIAPVLTEALHLNENERLLLINFDNPIPEDYFDTLELVEIENGHKMEAAAAEALAEMLAAMRAEGLNPVIRSSFRTNAEQVYLFNRQVRTQKARGYNDEQAFDAARRINAYPGTSEHEAGLAVDLVDYAYQVLDSKQANTDCGKWLIENCMNYGFILRYPNDKRDITNIIYEPWHYRYVGKAAAEEMYKLGLCLEEYHDYLSGK